MLKTHLQILAESETEAANYWNSLSDKDKYLEIIQVLNCEVELVGDSLDGLHLDARNMTSSQFVEIQEKPFEYLRIRKDWYQVVTSDIEKKKVHSAGEAYLQAFLNSNKHIQAHFYGGIKSEQSILRKVSQQSSGTAVQQNVLDLWDVIRFKVVVDTLSSLLFLTKQFWKENIAGIVRCRNYYFSPRQNSSIDSYRAIHFELVDDKGNIIEIQFVTERREVISTLDHPFTFKKLLKFTSDEHKQWLLNISKMANILDANEYTTHY